MHILFPHSPLNSRVPDELCAEQYGAFREAGASVSLFSLEAIQAGAPLSLSIPPVDILYRGWMLTGAEYERFGRTVEGQGAKMIVSLDQYLGSHHLPNWYQKVREFTAETVIVGSADATPALLTRLGWDGVFIKDYVKSLKTSVGSRITDPAMLPTVLDEMRRFRGQIEGGLCLRRIEDFKADSEIRYFVISGGLYGPNPLAPIPAMVRQVAERIPSPFFSIDVAERKDGVLRVVEIGDGQVSDLVGWDARRFATILMQRFQARRFIKTVNTPHFKPGVAS